MSDRAAILTKEALGAYGMVLLCGGTAALLVAGVPNVTKLPEGAATPLDYVLTEVTARFGIPVVVLLLFAAFASVIGHNTGEGRPGWDYASKLCSFGAAVFTAGATWAAFYAAHIASGF